MTARQIVNIVLRLWGALWALGAIINFPPMLEFATSVHDAPSFRMALSNALVNLVWLVVGAVLFFKSERIANAFFPDGEALSISATAPELQQIGFSLLAAYFGIGACSRLLGHLYVLIRGDLPNGMSRIDYVLQPYPGNALSAVIELAVCIALFLGSKRLSAFWQRLRTRDIAEE
jgi:hypothetical protein